LAIKAITLAFIRQGRYFWDIQIWGDKKERCSYFRVDFGKPFTSLGELPKVFNLLYSAAEYRIGASRAYL
jgi:hypothetical protein